MPRFAKDVPIPGKVTADEWGPFHDFIVVDELSRAASGGVMWGIIGGLGIGLPPVMRFADETMKKKVVGPCIRGEKRWGLVSATFSKSFVESFLSQDMSGHHRTL